MGVSGPTEFARLPLEDQLYWNRWFETYLENAHERGESVQEAIEDLG